MEIKSDIQKKNILNRTEDIRRKLTTISLKRKRISLTVN